MIAAMDSERGTGKNGDIPWNIPCDMKFFKAVTKGHSIVMGRKTAESLKGPLPDRCNIVLTRNVGTVPEKN